MSKEKDNTTATATAQETDNENINTENVALAPVSSLALDADDGFGGGTTNQALINALGEFDDLLKQVAVTEFTGARVFLDRKVTLLDVFRFVMQERDKVDLNKTVDVPKIMFQIADEGGEIHHVMQNAIASRDRFLKLYDQLKAANTAAGTSKKLTMTNMQFTEVGKPVAGNRCIVLQPTPDSRPLLN